MRPIFYDTETTGIRADSERIVELAAYDLFGNRSFAKLINPGIPIPKEASAVHGISDVMVADCQPFGAVFEEFISFCSGEDAVLIAHNNDNFDIHFLRNECSRHGVVLPPWRFMDTLKWARKYRPDLPRHSLQYLREMYGVAANNAHRALDDVMVLVEVYRRMTDDLPFETVYKLVNEQARHSGGGGASDSATMPFGKHQGKPLEEVPASYVKWLLQDGAFDKPENQALKEGFQRAGKLTAV